MPYLENIWRINRHARFADVIVLYTGMKITCLVSWLTITKIMSNLENDRSFLIKSTDCIWVIQNLQNCYTCQARFTPRWKSTECTQRWADLWNDLGFSLCAAPSVCHVVVTSDEEEKSEWEWVLNGVSPLNTGDWVQ